MRRTRAIPCRLLRVAVIAALVLWPASFKTRLESGAPQRRRCGWLVKTL